MSKKHEQRTRAEILARRAAPSAIPAPVPMSVSTYAEGMRFIAAQRFTAETRRAMRSKQVPHTGAKQLAKAETLAERARTRLAA